MHIENKMTLADGIAEFMLNCEARNLRPGTIRHYSDSVKQIYKYVPPDTLLENICEDTWDAYKIALHKKANLIGVSIYTYGRDFKTILRFFMKQKWIPNMELSLPKADKSPTLNSVEGSENWKVSLPDGSNCSFTGTCSVKLDGVGVNSALTYTLSIKPDSEMIWS